MTRKSSKILIHLFHRDLRTADQQGLQKARQENPGAKIIPVFIFTSAQISSSANPFKSSNSVRFLLESLEDLNEQTDNNLTIYYGETLTILQQLFIHLSNKDELVGLIETKDYTPFAIQRQQEVRGLCSLFSIPFYQSEETYLTEPGSILNNQGRMFQKFTPFWEKARQQVIEHPLKSPPKNVWIPGPELSEKISLKGCFEKFLEPESRLGNSVRHGGRKFALELLRKLPDNYDETHDLLAVETSRLSAHNHYGTVSIREVYWAAKNSMPPKKLDGFIRQLFWRDFYGHICWAFQELYDCSPYDFWTERDPVLQRREKATKTSYKSQQVKESFELWTKGQTGVELVDAGMRQLLSEGFIHNRARLVCADYLVKEMGVPWRWGEKWFAQHLIDYDFAQNFGNWCWVASVLPFSQAPFRRHNPIMIQGRLDPEKEYTRKWLSL